MKHNNQGHKNLQYNQGPHISDTYIMEIGLHQFLAVVALQHPLYCNIYSNTYLKKEYTY